MSKYTEVKHPDIGRITWEFKCPMYDALCLMPIFFDRYRYKGFNIFITHSMAGVSGVRIYDVPYMNLAEMMSSIFKTESSNRIISISVDFIMRAYVVNMELPLSRVEGAYRLWNRELVRMTMAEEQVFSFRQADRGSDSTDIVRFNLQAIARRLG